MLINGSREAERGYRQEGAQVCLSPTVQALDVRSVTTLIAEVGK